MTRNKIGEVRDLATLFVKRANTVLQEELEQAQHGTDQGPHDYLFGSAASGALKRTSMELTRALAQLRKS